MCAAPSAINGAILSGCSCFFLWKNDRPNDFAAGNGSFFLSGPLLLKLAFLCDSPLDSLSQGVFVCAHKKGFVLCVKLFQLINKAKPLAKGISDSALLSQFVIFGFRQQRRLGVNAFQISVKGGPGNKQKFRKFSFVEVPIPIEIIVSVESGGNVPAGKSRAARLLFLCFAFGWFHRLSLLSLEVLTPL